MTDGEREETWTQTGLTCSWFLAGAGEPRVGYLGRSCGSWSSRSSPVIGSVLASANAEQPGCDALLALRVLRRLAGALQAVLLALLDARVAREEPGLAQRRAHGFVVRYQRAGDAVANRFGLARRAAALHLYQDVKGALRVRQAQGQRDGLLVSQPRETLLQRLSVDDDVAGAGLQLHAGDRTLAAPHAGAEVPRRAGNGFSHLDLLPRARRRRS